MLCLQSLCSSAEFVYEYISYLCAVLHPGNQSFRENFGNGKLRHLVTWLLLADRIHLPTPDILP
jgi:hypothetical protein